MYQTIPVRYLDAWLEQGYTGRLIDLRTPEEYNVSHLCEAENIPFFHWAFRYNRADTYR